MNIMKAEFSSLTGRPVENDAKIPTFFILAGSTLEGIPLEGKCSRPSVP
jgi:hypothetical protein